MATTIVATQTCQIQCITKLDPLNPHERITHVGGTESGGWKLTQERAIALIEDGSWRFG